MQSFPKYFAVTCGQPVWVTGCTYFTAAVMPKLNILAANTHSTRSDASHVAACVIVVVTAVTAVREAIATAAAALALLMPPGVLRGRTFIVSRSTTGREGHDCIMALVSS